MILVVVILAFGSFSLGFLTACLLAASSRADDRAEEWGASRNSPRIVSRV
jgi:hypothetical protein